MSDDGSAAALDRYWRACAKRIELQAAAIEAEVEAVHETARREAALALSGGRPAFGPRPLRRRQPAPPMPVPPLPSPSRTDTVRQSIDKALTALGMRR